MRDDGGPGMQLEPPTRFTQDLAIKSLYAVTVFLGAFLLFLLEPLFAKRILPWFGGSASVWTSCLVFFQGALLVGYLYADRLVRRVSRARQATIHVALLAACVAFLPVAPIAFWRSVGGVAPSWRIFGLLATSIGVPFVTLSATTPLLQAWYARRHPVDEPYFLYAISNVASLVALLGFPWLIEPHLDARAQSRLWSALFGVFGLCCAALAWTGRASVAAAPARAAAPSAAVDEPTWSARLTWLSLSACGSVFLLSVTHQMCQNVAPIPLLWVLPLALYLLTFALAFNRPALYPRRAGPWILAVTLVVLAHFMDRIDLIQRIQTAVPVYLGGLFFVCLFCHGELAATRPAARHLTTFYLLISIGGAVGGIAVGLIAPALLNGIFEYQIALVVTVLVALQVQWRRRLPIRLLWTLGAIAMTFMAIRDVRFYQRDSISMTRDFYGAVQVTDEGTGRDRCRGLYNGTVDHGAQFVDPSRANEPTTYYGRDSGVALALTRPRTAPINVGVIGLGAGTLAAYGQAGDLFRFYDIDPQVITIAHRYFSFLDKSAARIEIVEGDARLSLEAEPAHAFDVLVVDAFSGDAIPVHLLTREAFSLYQHHLKPNGILAVHTSNQYLDLEDVVQVLADDAGYPACFVASAADEDNRIDFADWVLVTRDAAFRSSPAVSAVCEPIHPPPGLRPWTDDDNSLFPILRPL